MKMILLKRCFCVAILIASTCVTKAQTFSIGAKGGLLSSRFASGLENSSRSALYFGIITNQRIKAGYSLQVEINYSSKGSITRGLQPVPDFIYSQFNLPANRIIYGAYNRETILNNIEIPVMAKIELPVDIFVKYYMLVGPSISFVTGAKNITSGTSVLYQDAMGQTPVPFEGGNIGVVSYNNSGSGSKGFKKINISVESGCGLSYGHPYSAIKIFLEARFSMNISRIQQSGISPINKNQDTKSIAAGFLYKL